MRLLSFISIFFSVFTQTQNFETYVMQSRLCKAPLFVGTVPIVTEILRKIYESTTVEMTQLNYYKLLGNLQKLYNIYILKIN